MSETITTAEFKSSPAKLGRWGIEEWLSRWGWTMVIPFVALLICSAYDWRMLVVALALLFIAFPAILSFVFYSYALNPDTALLILPHNAKIGPEGITLTFIHTNDEHGYTSSRHISRNDIINAIDTGNALVIKTRMKPKKFEIPISAFPNYADFEKSLSYFCVNK